jgi:hypothetical protein
VNIKKDEKDRGGRRRRKKERKRKQKINKKREKKQLKDNLYEELLKICKPLLVEGVYIFSVAFHPSSPPPPLLRLSVCLPKAPPP